MEILKVPFQQVSQFSSKDVAYATKNKDLRPFFKYEVSIEAFQQVIQDKSKDHTNRKVLVEVLKEQYSQFSHSKPVQDNIELLQNEGTFTITTAHQPSLCTGPLYYIYKIASVIQLTKQLKEHYKDYHFVPVFVVGGEDHDFEEINHFHLFGKNIVWENEESGAVGQMKTASLAPVLEQLKEVLGDSDLAKDIYNRIHTAYTSHETYGLSAVHLTNSLFQDYGLVVLAMNHPKLKNEFIPYIEKEIIEQPSKQLVEEATERLEAAGFSGQAHARDINFFYLRPQIRNRIERENGHYKVFDTDYKFTETAIKEEVQQHPEYFSPNVVMRPIFQELILPNLAYIGGGGEISYWLERQHQFEHFGLNFPMLIRRNSALWIDKGTNKKINKLGLSLEDLFEETEALIKKFVKENTENEISLADEKGQLAQLFVSIINKATEIDPTIAKKVAAEQAKQLKSVEQIEGRLMRAEKQKYETALNQIRSLKDKLFPNNGLQERHDNFLNLYVKYGDRFLDTLVEHLNPLEEGMVVFWDKI